MKKYITNLFILVASILFFGCSNDDSSKDLEDQSFSGEELFSAIFFLEGDAASEINSLKLALQDSEELRASLTIDERKIADEFMSDFQNDLITNIKNINHNFFNEFKSNIESDNFYLIEESMINGVAILKEAGLASAKYGELFTLADKIKDLTQFDSDENSIANLEESKEKYNLLLQEEYGFNPASVPAIPGFERCFAILVVAVAVFAVGAVFLAVAGETYVAIETTAYTYTETWSSGDKSSSAISSANKAFIVDLAKSF